MGFSIYKCGLFRYFASKVITFEFKPFKVTTINANFTNDIDVDYYVIQLNNSTNSLLTIGDIHPGGGWEEKHPMMYRLVDAEKICKYLNDTKQFKIKQHWKWFDKMYEYLGGVSQALYYRPNNHKLYE